MTPANDHRALVSPALIEKFPQLRRVLGIDSMYPFGSEGAEPDAPERMIRAGTDRFA